MSRRRRFLVLALVLGCSTGCSPHRPAASPAAPPPAQPAPPPGDDAPIAEWYRANAARIAIDPNASAEDTAFTIDLIDWLVRGEEATYARIAPRVAQAQADRSQRIHPALQPTQIDEAKRLHELAAPLSAKPQGERDGAAEDRIYRKAAVLNPADPDLINHLAITASLRKDYASSERYARLAIAIDPDFISAYQELAYAYKNLDRCREAIAAADRGLRVDGDLHTKSLLLARKGQCHWVLGEKDQAMSAFQSSRRLGGPEWINSYLEGKQDLGKPYKE